MSLTRLQRFLSQAGIASRRHAEQFIIEGKISVNGIVIRELGFKVDPTIDKVVYQRKLVTVEPEHYYYLVYKPRGVLVTKKDPEKRKTIFDLFPNLPPSVNAVGRLDYDSEGLLLLTSDGELAYRLTHPSFEIKKTYHVQLDKIPEDKKIKELEKGIFLEENKTAPAKIRLLKQKPEIWISVEIHEGKKRQVRKMMEWAGCRVKRLIRVKFGAVKLGNLKIGKLTSLSQNEVFKLLEKG